MERVRNLVAALLLVLGFLFLCSSAYLYVEMREVASSPTTPQTSLLFRGYQQALSHFVPEATHPRPADYARVFGRGLYVLAGAGVFFGLGAAFLAMRRMDRSES